MSDTKKRGRCVSMTTVMALYVVARDLLDRNADKSDPFYRELPASAGEVLSGFAEEYDNCRYQEDLGPRFRPGATVAFRSLVNAPPGTVFRFAVATGRMAPIADRGVKWVVRKGRPGYLRIAPECSATLTEFSKGDDLLSLNATVEILEVPTE